MTVKDCSIPFRDLKHTVRKEATSVLKQLFSYYPSRWSSALASYEYVV